MKRHARPAFTVLEMTVAVLLLSVALASLIHLTARVQSAIRTNRRWAAVARTLDAAMESLTARGYDRVAVGTGRRVPPPAEVSGVVPGLALTVTVLAANVVGDGLGEAMRIR